MRKFIREYAPFIILGYSLVIAVFSYFVGYKEWYNYLSQLVGFSLFTNLFMYYVYMNNKYCTATKISVVGLISLNISTMVFQYFEMSTDIYDIIIIIIIFLVSFAYKSRQALKK